jgi:tRNA(fMet)-specific endonuclease VapC
MSYLLDTNAWIAIINPSISPVKDRFSRHRPDEILFCSVVKAELLWGAYRSSRKEKNIALLQKIFSQFVSLPFDDIAADYYGRIRADLNSKGTPIGPNDMMIAAIALANDLTVVTHNQREFGRVTGLKLEDWA